MHELVAYRDYVSGEPLSYWRSTSGFEVDFCVSLEARQRRVDGIMLVPVQAFLDGLWSGEYA